jgi:hypothetical protein
MMRKTTCIIFITAVLLGFTANAFGGETGRPLRVDVLYMDHGPMQPTLRELRSLFPEYGDKLAVFWHDFESEEGEQFKKKMGIDRHIPLVIWLDEKSTRQVNGSPVTFAGFPKGSGPFFARGKWEMADLKTALDGLTGRR